MTLFKRIVGVVVVLLLVAALGVFALLKAKLVAPWPQRVTPYEVQVLQAFEDGEFVESVRCAPDGTLYVASVSPTDAAKAWLWIRRPDGTSTRIDGIGNNLAVSPSGRVFVTTMHGTPTAPEAMSFTLDELVNGKPERRGQFEAGAQLNGLAFTSDDTLFAADSRLGCIWRWHDGEVRRWRAEPAFAPASLPGIPGLNGLRHREGTLWTVNSSTGQLLAVPLDGGATRVVAEGLPGDGLDLDAAGNVFVATHPFNTIEKVSVTGERTTVASLVGPTDVEVLPDGALLVVQDGGAFLALLPPPIRLLFPSVTKRKAALVRLHAP